MSNKMCYEVLIGQWPTAMANWEKEGKIEIQKLEDLKNKKSFLDEIKSIFQEYCPFSD